MRRVDKTRHAKKKIPIQDRICKVCDKGVVEDEEHFFLSCEAYDYERQVLLKKCDVENKVLPDIWDLCFNIEDNLFYVAIFLKKCFSKRENILSNVRIGLSF